MNNRKLLSVLLAVCMMISLFAAAPFTAFADDENWIAVGSKNELLSAISNGDKYIKLTADVNNSGKITIPAGTETVIDLAGHKIDRSLTSWTLDGGVFLVNGSLTVRDSSGNDSGKITGGWSRRHGAGVNVSDGGVFTLEGGNIYDNVTTTAASFGGGVYVGPGGVFNMTGGILSFNATPNYGGGVYLNEGEFNMSGGTLTMNGKSTNIYGVTPANKFTVNEGDGGAVYVGDGSTFNMTGGSIDGRYNGLSGGMAGEYNYAKENGGAVYVDEEAEFTMSGDAYISQGESNTGAVYVGGTFEMTDNARITWSRNGGVYVADGGQFTMNSGSVDNTQSGSGVFVHQGGVFIMNDGEISENSNAFGAGVLVSGGTFIMEDGAISGNTAGLAGGGVYLATEHSSFDYLVSGGVFNMNGGTITGNMVYRYNVDYPSVGNGDGGGVWIGVDSEFNMNGGSITGNRSAWMVYDNDPEINAGDWHYGVGAGVFVQSSEYGCGRFSISGAPVIQNNYIGSQKMGETAAYGVYVSNVYLDDTNRYNHTLRMIEVGALDEGARIGITALPKLAGGQTYISNLLMSVEEQRFTEGYSDSNSAQPMRYFTSDLPDYAVVRDGDEAKLYRCEHEFSLTASGHSLTLECGKCGTTEVLDLTAEDDEYAGEGYQYAGALLSNVGYFNYLLEYAGLDGSVSADDIEYYDGDAALAGAPAQPGNYTAKLTYTDKNGVSYTISCPFSITAAPHTHQWVYVEGSLDKWTGSVADGFTAAALYECGVAGCAETQSQAASITPDIPEPACVTAKTVDLTATVAAADAPDGIGRVSNKTVDIPAIGSHAWGFVDISWTGSDAAGYTAAAANYKCSRCEATESVTLDVTKTPADPGCEDDVSYSASIGATDSYDGQEHSASKNVSAAGHAWAFVEWIWTGDETNGYSDAKALFRCGSCNVEQTVTASLSSSPADPGCEDEVTVTAYVTAGDSLDGTAKEDHKTVNAAGHVWNFTGFSWTGSDEAGYTAAAANYACAHCDATVSVTPLSVIKNPADPGCEDDVSYSVSIGATDSYDGQEHSASKNVSARGHAWTFVEWIWTGDETNGYSAAKALFRCDSCGDEQTVTASLSSSPAAPGCEDEVTVTASVTAVDSLDGAAKEDHKTVNAAGHVWSFTGFVWTGSNEAGYTAAAASYVCAHCDATKTAGAGLSTVTDAAKCTADGSAVYTATVAAGDTPDNTERQDQKTVILKATGLELGDWNVTVPASCTEAGEKRRDCANCNYFETAVIKATGHSWGKWKVVQPATETEEGLEERVCSLCGETQRRIIPAGGNGGSGSRCCFEFKCFETLKNWIKLFVNLFIGIFGVNTENC